MCFLNSIIETGKTTRSKKKRVVSQATATTVPVKRRRRRFRCPVVCLDTGEHFHSIKEATLATGISTSRISACCRKESPTAGGLKWVYQQNTESL